MADVRTVPTQSLVDALDDVLRPAFHAEIERIYKPIMDEAERKLRAEIRKAVLELALSITKVTEVDCFRDRLVITVRFQNVNGKPEIL